MNTNNPKPRKLTANERRFVEEYCIDRNATRAYLRAFGRMTKFGKPRTYDGTRRAASDTLTYPHIKTEIAAASCEHARRCGISARRVLRELAAVAFADPADIFEASSDSGGMPTPRPWDEVPPVARRFIAAMKVKRRRIDTGTKDNPESWIIEEMEFKFHSKIAALVKLCEYLGLCDAKALEQIAALIQAERAREASTASRSLLPGEISSRDADAI